MTDLVISEGILVVYCNRGSFGSEVFGYFTVYIVYLDLVATYCEIPNKFGVQVDT